MTRFWRLGRTTLARGLDWWAGATVLFLVAMALALVLTDPEFEVRLGAVLLGPGLAWLAWRHAGAPLVRALVTGQGA